MCCEKISVSDSKLFSQAAIKWRTIGHLLKIPPGSLDGIGYDSRMAHDALSAVFTVWSRTLCSPYSWKTILSVLATDAVGHRRLANDIARRLPSKIGDCTCFNTCFTSSLILHGVQSCLVGQSCHCNEASLFFDVVECV